MGGRLVAGVVMRRRRVWRDLAAATLMLVAGGVLCWGVRLVYGLAAEYGRDVSGDSVGSGLGQAVIGGLLIGLLAWVPLRSAIRLIGRRLPVAAGALTAAAVVLVAVVGVAVAGNLGTRHHDQGEARARTACTATRVAAFVELSLPYTISSPTGGTGGECSDTFVVPGTTAAVDTRVDDRLNVLGWTRISPDPGPAQHYRRGDLHLTVRDEGDIGNSGNEMVSMTIS
jgi:hypothetical protein